MCMYCIYIVQCTHIHKKDLKCIIVENKSISVKNNNPTIPLNYIT